MATTDVQDCRISTDSFERVLVGVAHATQLDINSDLFHVALNLIHDTSDVEDDRSLSWVKWYRIYSSKRRTFDHISVGHLLDLTLAVTVMREKSRSGHEIPSALLDFTWGLIREALSWPEEKSCLKFKVNRSAQGFLSIPLCSRIRNGNIQELFRLHVWLPDSKRGLSKVSVHSHQPFAQSWILAGSGTDHSFDVKSTDDPTKATHAEYVPHWDAGEGADTTYMTFQIKSTLKSTGKLCIVKERDTTVHSRGMSYSIPSVAYHTSDIPAEEFHATLFYFDSSRGFYKDAGVLGPVEGGVFTQLRDARPYTAPILAQLTEAIRRADESKLEASGDEKDSVGRMHRRIFETFRVKAEGENEEVG